MNETISAPRVTDRRPNTVVNALVGGLVSLLLAWVPFSPVLGGAVAGYLEGGDGRRGLRVGAYAGVVAGVPLALLAVLLAGLVAVVPVTSGSAGGPELALLVVVGLVALFVGAVYAVGLSALGGYVGASLTEERFD